MADEITANASLTVNNGSLSATIQQAGQIDQSNARMVHKTATVTTSGTVLDFDDLVSPRLAVFRNLDDTNHVLVGVGVSSIVPFLRLDPGEFALCPLQQGTTFRALADTATVLLEMFILDA